MNEQTPNREISLIDLVIDMMLHWRGFILAMVIGACVFSCTSYANALENVEKQKINSIGWEEMDETLLRSTLTEEQINNVELAFRYQQMLRDKYEYATNSILMQLNPTSVPCVEMSFWLDAEEIEKSYDLKELYQNIMTSVSMYDYVYDKCGIKGVPNELFIVQKDDVSGGLGGNILGNAAGVISGSISGELQKCNTIRIAIVHKDSDVAQMMADVFIECLELRQKELQDTLGEHSILLVDKMYGETKQESVANVQNEYFSGISYLKYQHDSLVANFSAGEHRYLNYLNDREDDLRSEAISANEQMVSSTLDTAARPRVSAKYVGLGMLIFAFVYAVVLFVSYILNNKLRENDVLQDIYHIPQLGFIEREKEKKLFEAIDECLRRLRYHNRRRFDKEEAIALSVVAIKVAIKKAGKNSICLVGCNLKNATMDICSSVKEKLEGENISVQILSNVLYDAEAMERLSAEENVVLVETANSTLYDEITAELELMERQQINVFGGIVVG